MNVSARRAERAEPAFGGTLGRRFAPVSGDGQPRWRVPESSLPIWVFERQTGAIVAVNDADVRAYGYSREELLSRHVHDLCPPDRMGRSPLTARYDADTVQWDAFRQQRRDGSGFDAELAMIGVGAPAHEATMILVHADDGDPAGPRAASDPRSQGYAGPRRAKTLIASDMTPRRLADGAMLDRAEPVRRGDTDLLV